MHKAGMINILFRFLVVLSLYFVLTGSGQAQDYDDSVMRYYLQNVDSVLSGCHLFDTAYDYTVDVKALFSNINYRGELSESDTTGYKAVFKAGIKDTSTAVDSVGVEDNIIPDDISFIKPWEQDCRFYFFPNDTGGSVLAIGFEPNNPDSGDAPAGILIIDRYNFRPQKIYLHYREIGKYDRLSKSYEFMETESGMVLNHLIIQGSYLRFFSRSYFRQDLYFSNYSFIDS